ncbi:hypothetical protein NMD1_01610 [Novosphingobium sp. MD-1]|nr:hypothetical protein NMD1_01610 [Novosphingobium sp. MD-1]
MNGFVDCHTRRRNIIACAVPAIFQLFILAQFINEQRPLILKVAAIADRID